MIFFFTFFLSSSCSSPVLSSLLILQNLKNMSNCEKNASNDNAVAPRRAAASALHAMPDDSPQLIKIQENVRRIGV